MKKSSKKRSLWTSLLRGVLILSLVGWAVFNLPAWERLFAFAKEEAGFRIPFTFLIGLWLMFLLAICLVNTRHGSGKGGGKKNGGGKRIEGVSDTNEDDLDTWSRSQKARTEQSEIFRALFGD